MGNFHLDQEFMVWTYLEDLVMEVQWFCSKCLLEINLNDHIKILDTQIRGLINENPIEFGQKKKIWLSMTIYWSVPIS